MAAQSESGEGTWVLSEQFGMVETSLMYSSTVVQRYWRSHGDSQEVQLGASSVNMQVPLTTAHSPEEGGGVVPPLEQGVWRVRDLWYGFSGVQTSWLQELQDLWGEDPIDTLSKG